MDAFTIKQQYYSGNFKTALQAVEKLNSSEQDTVVFYRAKCLIALGKYEKKWSDAALGSVADAYVDLSLIHI